MFNFPSLILVLRLVDLIGSVVDADASANL